MSKLQFETELRQLHGKLVSLYGEMQQLFLRHGDTNPQAAKAVMPHLEMAKKAVEGLTAKVEKPARLMESGD